MLAESVPSWPRLMWRARPSERLKLSRVGWFFITAALLVAFPAAAPAAVVQVHSFPAPLPEHPGPRARGPMLHTLEVRDGDGERNALTVTVARGRALVHDGRSALHAGRGCRLLDSRTVTCVKPRFFDVRVMAGRDDDAVDVRSDVTVGARLGQGDDVFTLRRTRSAAWVDAGPGDDRVTGAAGADSLSGGGGHDVLRGRGGFDELDDGDTSGTANRDVLDGGRGRKDHVWYDKRTADMDIDLARTDGQGERGENDAIIGIENVVSGSGRDVLRGNDADNWLNARAGRGDVVIGRRGDDDLWNAKRYAGGPGNDIVIYGERGARVSCGRGDDNVTDMHRRGRNFFGAACERIGLLDVEGSYRSLIPLSSPGAPIGRFSAGCGSFRPCSFTLSVFALTRSGAVGERIGHTAATVSYQHGRILRLRLSSRGRELLRRRGRLRVFIGGKVVEPKSKLGPRRVIRDGFDTILH
jgi:hemolysin type calcium-binding protein